MPKSVFGEAYRFLPNAEILTFDELARVARIFVALGITKLRLTGGEPLLRPGLDQLIARLSGIAGLEDLTLTTNGAALVRQASALRAAGLHRLTVSLDALDDDVFRVLNDADFPVTRVLAGIEAVLAAGFAPIKINMVVKRGVNCHQIVPMARRFRGPEFILRFIEYMDVGNTNGWRLDEVVSGEECIARVSQEFPLEALPSNYEGEVARRFRHIDGGGEIGIITSVTAPFCAGCTRARVSAAGQFHTCLFNGEGFDLRALLRSGKDDGEIAECISGVWHQRTDRYSEIRTAIVQQTKAEMSLLGG
jgi:cyclic pyranopterin phosphate synthase